MFVATIIHSAKGIHVTMQPSFRAAKCATIQVHKKILPFFMQFQPTLKWHSIQNQPNHREKFKESSLISYRKGKSLKDVPVKAKL